jgi:RNA polymerase sigma-70 factor (ECF subfamily)
MRVDCEDPLADPDAIVRRFGPHLYEYARHLTRNPNDASDLVQDTFERCLRKMPGNLTPINVQSWLQVTLRNRYVDLRRTRRRRRLVLLNETAGVVPAKEALEQERWSQIDPSELWLCVQRLDPRLREVFVLRNRDRLSHAEIAVVLSIPVSTVGTRCHRAARHLRRMLDQLFVERWARRESECGVA